MENRIRVNDQGTPLSFEFVGTTTGVERAMWDLQATLARLGVELRIRLQSFFSIREEVLNHRFDITQTSFVPSVPPGVAASAGWHRWNADVPGYALAGSNDPALDAAIEVMTRSTVPDVVRAATRAFDRVICWQHYIVPLWHNDRIWIAHDSWIGWPDQFTLRRFGHPATLWWADSGRRTRD